MDVSSVPGADLNALDNSPKTMYKLVLRLGVNICKLRMVFRIRVDLLKVLNARLACDFLRNSYHKLDFNIISRIDRRDSIVYGS